MNANERVALTDAVMTDVAVTKDVLDRIELNKLLDERQRQVLELMEENNTLKRVNAGLKNRLSMALRSVLTNVQARRKLI